MKIIWVEDEAKDQLLELLGPVWMEGHFVDIAVTAMEGLEKIKKFRYDVYIFDLRIRKGDVVDLPSKESSHDVLHGLELIKEIFKDSSEADIDPSKCAVFSVAKKKEIHDEIRKCGIEKIFVKTEMKRTKLMEIIESVIGSDDHDK